MGTIKDSVRPFMPGTIRIIYFNLRILYFKLRTLGFGYRYGDGVDSLRKKINLYFKVFPSKKQEYAKEFDFLNTKNDPFIFTDIFPYSFSLDYKFDDVEVYKDENRGLYYVMHDGKRLYYSRNYKDVNEVKKSYTCIAIEQNPESPHRYLDENFKVSTNDIVADIGAAEGNFSLEIVDKVKELYIFEAEEHWIEALNATFEPWKDKVHIINKYVSNQNNDRCVTLEKTFFNKSLSIIKMDVEGAETSILKCATKFLGSRDLKLVITTYHGANDAEDIKQILRQCNYQTKFSKGFMLFIFDNLTPPYFRKAMIKAIKNKNY